MAWFAYTKTVGSTPRGVVTAADSVDQVWKALSGNTVELDGEVVTLEGVSCPGAETPAGQDARDFLAGLLKSGHVECVLSASIRGRTALCHVNGRDINAEVRTAALCN